MMQSHPGRGYKTVREEGTLAQMQQKNSKKNKTHLIVTNHFGYLQTLGSMQLSSRKALGSGLDELEVYAWR
jgi:hypothetical protein